MWFYAKNGEQHGPVEADAIRERLKSGDLSSGTLVWREGMVQWTPLGEVLELRDPVPAPGSAASPSEASSPAPLGAAGFPPQGAPQIYASPQLVAPVQQNNMALMSMILGILSFFCFGFLTGIPAIICGHIARKQLRESPVPQSGAGMATAGLVLGYLTTVLTLVAIVIYIAFFAVAIGAASSGAPTPLPVP